MVINECVQTILKTRRTNQICQQNFQFLIFNNQWDTWNQIQCTDFISIRLRFRLQQFTVYNRKPLKRQQFATSLPWPDIKTTCRIYILLKFIEEKENRYFSFFLNHVLEWSNMMVSCWCHIEAKIHQDPWKKSRYPRSVCDKILPLISVSPSLLKYISSTLFVLVSL